MRSRSALALALSCFVVSGVPLAAQDFAGTFSVPNEVGGVMTVILSPSSNGLVTGSMSSNGAAFQMEGQVEDGTLVGTVRGATGEMFFEADRWENELWLTLYAADANGQPNYADFTEIDLVAQGSAGQAPAVAPGAPASVGGGVLAGGQTPGGGGVLGGGTAADPYIGTFSDGSVTLELQGAGGQYQGRVSVNGAVYQVAASAGANGLQGMIQTPQGTFPMSVSPTSGGVVVQEGGAQYNLTRSGGSQGGASSQATPQTALGQQGGGGSTTTGRQLAPGFTDNHPMLNEWVTFLSGMKVTRTESYSSGTAGGYSARTDVYLCSDRSFSMRDESSVSVDVGGAFGNTGGVGGGQGTWYLITNGQVVGLVLEHAGGQADEYRLDYDYNSQATYANGERVYVTPAEICR